MSVSSLFNECDIDNIMSRPVESSTLTRWERKAAMKERSRTKTPGRTPGKRYVSDRFIPSRDSMNKDMQLHSVNNENLRPDSNCQQEFNSKLAQSLFEGDDINSRILSFREKAPKPSEGYQNNLRVLYTQNREKAQVKKTFRHIASTPERILDAPDLLDDFYLNLLDWSTQNILAVGLGPCVYLWDANSGEIDLLCETKEDDHLITSVKWMADGSHVALGTSHNDVQMWNIERKKQVRSMKSHMARVGSLAWNNHILSSGSRDSTIHHHDVRIAQHHVNTLVGHQQEICGLTWSPDGTQLASGGNDNMCCIWDANASTPRYSFTESSAAVKALAWCPFQRNLLASGGGTADRHIRFYNTMSGRMVNSIDTKSQVCSLLWSKTEKEIMSSHGFSQNQLCVWKYPSMVKVAELTGHTSRVLHTSLSADGTTVCSAAADETLRFWKVWDSKKSKRKSNAPTSGLSKMRLNIR